MGQAVQDLFPYLALGGKVGSTLLGAQAVQAEAGAIESAANYNARLALLEGSVEEARRRRLGAVALGEARTAIGASGVRPEGSPLAFLASQAAELERNAMTARISGQAEAALQRSKALSAAEAGKRLRAATLFGGLASAAGYAYENLLPAGEEKKTPKAALALNAFEVPGAVGPRRIRRT